MYGYGNTSGFFQAAALPEQDSPARLGIRERSTCLNGLRREKPVTYEGEEHG